MYITSSPHERCCLAEEKAPNKREPLRAEGEVGREVPQQAKDLDNPADESQNSAAQLLGQRGTGGVPSLPRAKSKA